MENSRKGVRGKSTNGKQIVERLCEMCGDPIPKQRLAVLPNTTKCIRCARQIELEREADPELPIEIPAGYDPADLLDSFGGVADT